MSTLNMGFTVVAVCAVVVRTLCMLKHSRATGRSRKSEWLLCGKPYGVILLLSINPLVSERFKNS